MCKKLLIVHVHVVTEGVKINPEKILFPQSETCFFFNLKFIFLRNIGFSVNWQPTGISGITQNKILQKIYFPSSGNGFSVPWKQIFFF